MQGSARSDEELWAVEDRVYLSGVREVVIRVASPDERDITGLIHCGGMCNRYIRATPEALEMCRHIHNGRNS